MHNRDREESLVNEVFCLTKSASLPLIRYYDSARTVGHIDPAEHLTVKVAGGITAAAEVEPVEKAVVVFTALLFQKYLESR